MPIVFAVLLSLCCALWPLAGQAPLKLPEGVEALRDIEYATTPEKKLLLDIYRPKADRDRPRPLLVWVHGGGWRGGSRNNPRRAIRLVQRGYVVASISCRLSGEAIFPAQIRDVKAALRWLRAHAEEYGIDPKRVAAWGSSAGGHLVALLGTSAGVEELEGSVGGNLDQSSRVQAVVDYFGPTDFLQMDAHSISRRLVHDKSDSPESLLIGGAIRQRPDKVARANPIRYVSADDPPFLIVHGDQDPLVPHHQSELLVAALREAGVEAELYTVEGGAHGRGGEFGSDKLFERVAAFLERALDWQPGGLRRRR